MQKYFFPGALLGLAFFFALFGWQILNPQHISWLINASGGLDSIQHLSGWEFFRHESWQFPFGKIIHWGYPQGASIVYTDSIPLFALIFKIFSPWLPAKFQYFGLWILFCYLLQGIFAWKLCEFISENNLIKLCVTLLFLLSPIMLNRVVAGHQSLAGQWTLLASLYLYLLPYQRKIDYGWMVLIAVTLLIHAYLLIMVLALWFAFCIKNYVNKQISFLFTIRQALVNITVVLLLAWLTGYFTVPFSHALTADGYGLYSMNLLAPINPAGWSIFLKTQNSIAPEQQFEGFNYFGSGTLLLFFLSIYEILKKPPARLTVKAWKPLLVISGFFIFFALSNRVTLGTHVLIHYPMPTMALRGAVAVFRSSGRLFWPVYYFFMLGACMIIIRRNNSKTAGIILLMAVCLQLLDFSKNLEQISSQFRKIAPFHSIMDTAFWNTVPRYYQKIFFVPQVRVPDHPGDYFLYAADHKMFVNGGYFARKNNEAFTKFGQALLSQVAAGKLNNRTVYVILNPDLMNTLRPKLKATDKIEKTGNYWAIAPDWYNWQKRIKLCKKAS